MSYEIKKTTLVNEEHSATIINLAKQNYKKIGMDGLPLALLGLSNEANITVSHTIIDGEYIDWNFGSFAVSDLKLSLQAKVIGISDEGFILIQENNNFAVVSHES